MKYAKDKDQYILRLEKGEEIIQKLEEFCQKENISAGYFSGIGAFLYAEISFYNLEEKEYHPKELNETHEIASLTGNVSLVDGKPFFHIHCVLSNNNFSCFGGHLKKALIGATCEIYLKKIDARLERKQDDEIGLKLLDLQKI